MAEHLTPKQAAIFITMSISWLEKRRADGKGPPHRYVPGTRRVYYDRAELENWMRNRPNSRRHVRHDGTKSVTWDDMVNTKKLEIDDTEVDLDGRHEGQE